MPVISLLRSARPALMLVVMAVSASLSAQGLPMLSDPIDTERLMEMADELVLSPDQRLGLEPIHDAYLARFARLRDGDIQEFQDELLAVGMSFAENQFRIPERQKLEELLASYQAVLVRITETDRMLLSELEGLLTDEQLLRMERTRRRRELEVQGMIAFEISGDMNEGAGINLSALLDSIELTPAEHALIDTARSGYEAALLARVHDLHDAFEEAAVFALDTIDELGFREMTMPELMEIAQDVEMMTTIQVRFDEGSKPVQAANHALSQLNLRTYRALAPLLDPERAAALRDKYYRRAYARAWQGDPVWRQHYERALAMTDLAPDVIESTGAARETFVRQDDQAVEAIVVLLEDERAYRTFARASGMEPDPDREKRDELIARRTSIAEQAESTLASLLGPEAYAALDDAGAGADGGTATAAAASGPRAARNARDGAGDDEKDRMPRVRGLPRPMPSRDRKTLGERLQLTAPQLAVLRTLHEDYRAEWRSQLEAVIAANEDDAGDETDDDRAPDAERLAAAWNALAALDDTLFEEVGLTLTTADAEPALARLRQARRNAVLLSVTRNLTRRGDSEGWVDLLALVLRSSLSNDELAQVAGDLDAYASGVEPLLAERLELARTARRRRATMERIRASDRPGARELADSIEAKWLETRKAIDRKTGAIATFNRSALSGLVASLDRGPGQRLRFAYNREAHAEVYRAAVELEKMFDTALALPDLAPHQRDRIAEISTGFREDFDRLAEREIEFRRARTSWSEMPDLAQIEREIAIERLRFDSRELSARTRMRLELALTPGQAAVLPARRRSGRRGR